MAIIENPESRVKINSSLFKDFSSPIKENPNTYMKVNDKGQIIYKTIQETALELGASGGSTITDWQPDTEYAKGQLVLYKNCIFRCKEEDYISGETFEPEDWDIIAGYAKYSEYFNASDEMTSIQLEREVGDKSFLQINVNNSILQTDQYTLEDDGKTITFNEPLPVNAKVNVITYGNFTLMKTSRIVVKNFTATDGQTEFDAGVDLINKNLTVINVNNSVLQNTEWELDKDNHTIRFNEPLKDGDKVQVTGWSDIDFNVGATFTPVPKRVEDGVELSWTNNGDLDNPQTVLIRDGKSLTPKGDWDKTKSYEKSDVVTYEDYDYKYNFTALKDVPEGIEITDKTYWNENFRIQKFYATFNEWDDE